MILAIFIFFRIKRLNIDIYIFTHYLIVVCFTCNNKVLFYYKIINFYCLKLYLIFFFISRLNKVIKTVNGNFRLVRYASIHVYTCIYMYIYMYIHVYIHGVMLLYKTNVSNFKCLYYILYNVYVIKF